MSYCVYIHKCPNNKVYVGLTCQKPTDRWAKGKHYPNNKYFQNAIQKYGWDNIEHIIVKDNLTKEEACKLEIELIAKYKSTDRNFGYNFSIGGDASTLGYKHTEEAKRKISIASSCHKQTENQKRATLAYIESKKRKVNIYDIDGNFITSCNSITEAENVTGVGVSNIVACCKKNYNQCKGYIFRYSDDTEKVTKNRIHIKPVNMYSLDNEFIKRFESIKKASREMNIADTHIIDCCKGKYTQSGGYIWRYA